MIVECNSVISEIDLEVQRCVIVTATSVRVV